MVEAEPREAGSVNVMHLHLFQLTFSSSSSSSSSSNAPAVHAAITDLLVKTGGQGGWGGAPATRKKQKGKTKKAPKRPERSSAGWCPKTPGLLGVPGNLADRGRTLLSRRRCLEQAL